MVLIRMIDVMMWHSLRSVKYYKDDGCYDVAYFEKCYVL